MDCPFGNASVTVIVSVSVSQQTLSHAVQAMAPKKTKPPPASQQSHRRIVFFHPDLGIGGAERLIVDAAVGLQELGNNITIFTSHCDPSHCFEEVRDGQSYCPPLALYARLKKLTDL